MGMLKALQRSLADLLGLRHRSVIANERGVDCYDRGDFDRALHHFNDALLHAPYLAGARCNRANTLACLGRVDEALADYTQALDAEPILAAFIGRGNILAEAGHHHEALADFTEALRLDHTCTLAYVLRGHVLAYLGQYDEAWADYDSALRRDPNRLDAWVMRGRMADLLGRPQQALSDYEEVFRRDDGSLHVAVAYNNRGHVRHQLGDYGGARADFLEARRRAPQFPNPYKNLAWLAATCPDAAFRDAAAAVEAAELAWQLSGGAEPQWQEIVAAAYAEAGRFTEAVAWQERACASAHFKDVTAKTQRLDLYRQGQPYRDSARQGLREERIRL